MDVLRLFLEVERSYRSDSERLVRQIQEYCLSQYQPNANDTSPWQRSDSFGTNFLESSFTKTLEDKCKFLARSAFREWFDQQLVGSSHWPHVKYTTTNARDGQVEVARTLRKTCELLVAVRNDNFNLNTIGRSIAAKYAAIFQLRHDHQTGQDPAAMIAQELRLLVQLSTDAMAQHFHKFGGHKKPARHDAGMPYFTCMSVDEYKMPWQKLPPWETYELADVELEAARGEWLQLVGAFSLESPP